jgi:branched-chain amino acid transport system substrate-binding protein
MSTEKSERSEFAPKWARHSLSQGGGGNDGELPKGGDQMGADKGPTFLRRSLEPEIVQFHQSASSWSPGRLASIGGLIIATTLGAAVGVFFTDAFPAKWTKVLGIGGSNNTTEFTSRFSDDGSKPAGPVSSNGGSMFASAGPQQNPDVQARVATVGGGGDGSGLAPSYPPPRPTGPGGSAATVLPVAPILPQPQPQQQAQPQPAYTAPSRVASLEQTPNVRGITDQEVRFGISAPFSGAAKELGDQMKLGIETAFDLANESGGINGRMARLVVADDGYEPTRTADTMRLLYDKQQVFGFVGNVGTPTAAVALPYALEHRALFFGAFTGADLLRRDPPDRYVFNYRASYTEETDAVVRYLVKVRRIPPAQIAVFAQRDAFGDAGFAGVAKAMRALHAMTDDGILRLDYERNTVNVDDAVARLRAHKAPIRAIVMVAAYRAAAKFIEKTRDVYPQMIYSNVSFVGSTALAEELMLLGPRYASGVIVTQVVPAIDSYASAILRYKNALAKYNSGQAPDYVSFEGYVDGTLLLEGLRRAGPQPDTEKLVDSLESIHNFDMGLGTFVNFGPTEHQGSHKVWGTQLNEQGHYDPIDLQ